MTNMAEPTEAMECWQTMIDSGVPIGGEWVAVRVAHANDLHAVLSSAPQEPDDELIERLKDMRDFCRGTTHTHPHPNNVARLCEDVLAVLQAKAPETGEG